MRHDPVQAMSAGGNCESAMLLEGMALSSMHQSSTDAGVVKNLHSWDTWWQLSTLGSSMY